MKNKPSSTAINPGQHSCPLFRCSDHFQVIASELGIIDDKRTSLAVFAGQGEEEEEESLKSYNTVRGAPRATQQLPGRGPLSQLVFMDDRSLGPGIISDFLLFPEHLSFPVGPFLVSSAADAQPPRLF